MRHKFIFEPPKKASKKQPIEFHTSSGMDWDRCVLVSLAVLSLFSGVHSQSILKMPPDNTASSADLYFNAGGRKMIRLRTSDDDDSYCESWKFTVENDDAGVWSTVPIRCVEFVKNYVTGDRYLSDSEFAAANSLSFAEKVTIASDGKDCWVFDIDETLLSNLPYYAAHGYGSEAYSAASYDEWTGLAVAPALPASLSLYKELQQLNFTIVLLTGRSEPYRNATVKNLLFVGYNSWERLILRGPSDEAETAIVYKSKKRQELKDEGYRIHGSSGDQWSDLLGNATAVRSFKLPNPMYYIA